VVLSVKRFFSWHIFHLYSAIIAIVQHTHTNPFNGPFPGLPGWAGTRKAKPIWILLKQETVSGSGISWAICKSAPNSRQITTPAPHYSVFYRPDALPAAQPTASKHWRPDCHRTTTSQFVYFLSEESSKNKLRKKITIIIMFMLLLKNLYESSSANSLTFNQLVPSFMPVSLMFLLIWSEGKICIFSD